MPEWSAELEEQLPHFLRDDSQTFKPNSKRSFLHLSEEAWVEMER